MAPWRKTYVVPRTAPQRPAPELRSEWEQLNGGINFASKHSSAPRILTFLFSKIKLKPGKMSYFVGDIPVLQRPVTALDAPTSNYGGLDPVTKKLPEGFKKSSSYRGFRACTILEKDIEIPLRDGKIIRADVYRPADFDDKVPALVAWSPYGKSGVGTLAEKTQDALYL